MKEMFMNKINNRGIGPLPILVLSLAVGIGVIVGYNFYSHNEVLSLNSVKSINSDFLAQRPDDYDKKNIAKVDVTLISKTDKFETYEVRVTGTGQGSKDIRDIITRRGVKRIDGVDYNNSKISLVRPSIVNGNGFFTFNLIAYPNTLTFYVDSPSFYVKAEAGKVPAGWKINNKRDGLDRIEPFKRLAVVDITFKGNQGINQIYEVKVTGTGSGSKMIRDIITKNGVVRLDGKNYNQTNVTVLKPRIFDYPGYFTFTVVAIPSTLTFFVNSPSIYVEAEPGKIPTGWRINNKMDGIDRIRR